MRWWRADAEGGGRERSNAEDGEHAASIFGNAHLEVDASFRAAERRRRRRRQRADRAYFA